MLMSVFCFVFSVTSCLNFSFNLQEDVCLKLNPAVPKISPDAAEQHHLDVCYSLKGFAAASVSDKSNHRLTFGLTCPFSIRIPDVICALISQK